MQLLLTILLMNRKSPVFGLINFHFYQNAIKLETDV